MDSGDRRNPKDFRLTPGRKASEMALWKNMGLKSSEDLPGTPEIFRDSFSGDEGSGKMMDTEGGFKFGFVPGVRETMEISFGSAERPRKDFGLSKRSESNDEQERGSHIPMAHAPSVDGNKQEIRSRVSSGLMPPPQRKESLMGDKRVRIQKKQSGSTPGRRVSWKSPTVQGALQDDRSELLLKVFNTAVEGEGFLGSDDEIFVDRDQRTTNDCLFTRKRPPAMGSVPEFMVSEVCFHHLEEPAPQRPRSMSQYLTEQIFTPRTRNSTVPAGGVAGVMEPMETEVLFKNGQESPRRSSRRDSLSLTQLLGMPTTEVKEVTVEDFFIALDIPYKSGRELAQLQDLNSRQDKPKPPPANLEESLLAVLDTLREQKLKSAAEWLKARCNRITEESMRKEEEVNESPPDVFKNLKDAGSEELEEIKQFFQQRAAECEELAKSEWRGQRMGLELWHLEQVKKAKALVKDGILQIQAKKAQRKRYKQEKATKAEEARMQCLKKKEMLNEKLRELEEISMQCTKKRRQQNAHRQERMKILNLKKELFKLKSERREFINLPKTSKELLEEMCMVDFNSSLQPFALESISMSTNGGRNATLKGWKCFEIYLENFPELESTSLPVGNAVATLKARHSNIEDLNVQKAAWTLAGLEEISGKRIQEFYNGPQAQAQSVLQERFRSLTGIIMFLTEVNGFHKGLLSCFLGWKLNKDKILCEFGKPHFRIELTIDVNPVWYPFGGALDFAVNIVFTKQELHNGSKQIEESLKNVEPGYNHVSRVLEKIVNVLEAL